MKILLTGASGFIGRHCLSALSKAHELHALTRSLKDLAPELKAMERVTWHEISLHQHERLRMLVTDLNTDRCLHLAWDTEPGRYLDDVAGNLALLQDSLELLKALVASGCPQVLMLGSCAEYAGSAQLLPTEGRLDPQTIYAAAKAALSVLGPQICKGTDTKFCWARLFYLYGPGEHPKRLVSSLLDALLKGQTFPCSQGNKLKDYLYIQDVIAAIACLLEKGASGPYNICSAEPVSIAQIAAAAEAATQTSGLVLYGAVPQRAWDPDFIAGDNAGLKALGWRPRFQLASGLQDYVAALRKDRR